MPAYLCRPSDTVAQCLTLVSKALPIKPVKDDNRWDGGIKTERAAPAPVGLWRVPSAVGCVPCIDSGVTVPLVDDRGGKLFFHPVEVRRISSMGLMLIKI